MMPMTLERVAQAINATLVPASVQSEHGSPVDPSSASPSSAIPTNVVIDSRQAHEGSLFVAINGEHADGHAYVATLGDSGALAAIVDHEIPQSSVVQLVVDDTVKALGELARHNLAQRRAMAAAHPDAAPFSIVGITGSVGKTTTKDLLHALLGELGETVAPVGSFNNELGLPLTALQVGPSSRFLIAEMGANHLGEIANLTHIAPPDVAVVLKVGNAHLGEFGSVERIAQAKSEIVRGEVPGGMTILNADDPHVAAMDAIAPGLVRWFGLEHATEHDDYVTADHVRMDDDGHAVFTLRQSDGAYQQVRLGIPGAHNVMNALAATAVAQYFGLPLRHIVQVLEQVRAISPHRMAISIVRRPERPEFTLIDDSFNANPDSMRAGIDGIAAFNAAEPMLRIAVLGAMLELGPDETALHEAIGKYAVEQSVDAVIAVGNSNDAHLMTLATALAAGARDAHTADGAASVAEAELQPADLATATVPIAVASSTDEAEQMLDAILAAHHPDGSTADNTVVLLKGSHASGLASLAEHWASFAL
ncbi:UDP-N-acetylmuramoyl-tripeptide--D-alanyl-D-alanine ligase [Bifidobacterium gallicum]|uniref:UDP-N-acetylmuramoyl-tripeptide--D-alanyl-D-alanine ligase n=1 Tax=Bifidobacterium gallicum DSM 20093 = LMG 11596 TaxID=561180 RepID=D1NSW7_9BIFI|nr:UDP-N-acetylmuramoyl-tripeptide--D-alanyl-D-alanine ligase [Bifidobacterium gallicum]EFA23769.1 UDP-N-acetylmuramoyl-tripeptide--D-alanyl-D-alanine ligase [Bifidobacterium gallicum DSM 20093 = LMG 11596]KFI59218.1 UDP-N-acetylmuramoyl-tripeptide--D-alanyl-D- alanine ligase [Bifidobacterium gallicum DSM 20093 = LMG 11596]